MAKRSALPAVGSVLFFEGFEYHFEGSPKPGQLDFVRPKGGDARYARVSISAEELGRHTGKELAEAAQAEHGHWMRRLPSAPPVLDPQAAVAARTRQIAALPAVRQAFSAAAASHAQVATAKLGAAATRQFYCIEADPEDGFGKRPLRVMAPPAELAGLPIPKAQTRLAELRKAAGRTGPAGTEARAALGLPDLSITQSPPSGEEG